MERIDRNDDLLAKQIETMIEDLEGLTPGSEEYSRLSADIARLQHQLTEDQRMMAEAGAKADETELAEKKFKAETENQKKNRIVSIGETAVRVATDVALALVGMKFYKGLTNDAFQFETTGSISSGTGRRIMNSIKLPKIGKIF